MHAAIVRKKRRRSLASCCAAHTLHDGLSDVTYVLLPLLAQTFGLTLAQVVKLASSDQLLCFFRFNDHAMLTALTAPAKHADIAPTHAAILLAGQPAEQFV